MAATRVLVFADSGPRIGGGHAMRCLTLARALAARGAACAFAATPATQAILQAFGAPGIEVLPVSGELDAAAAEAAGRAASFGADWVLLDHYFLNPDQEASLRAGRRLAVLDDLADRPRAADLVMDSAYGCEAAAYRPLLPAGAHILTGPAYAPVRPEFAARRVAALARRAKGGHLRHVLISLGLTDVEGITERVVGILRPMLGDLILDVVVGSAAPSLPGLCAAAKCDPHLRLHVDSHEMAQLMATADIAVGAGGSSTWERAALGLPTATVVLADNQRPMARAMARDGLTLTADVAAPGFEDDLIGALHKLIGDAALRRTISHKAAAACDGLGAQRVADALLI
jgi:UDP-2,4-diacetamido-2,4,6-trideoxy-beta-L-altropyranose hydrolase